MSLPTDATERKAIPIYSGFLAFFPDAIAEAAKHSKQGSEQHHPDKGVFWDRSKSTDEYDALSRHLLGTIQAQSIDEEIEHAAAVFWRSGAHLQKLCEKREEEQEDDDVFRAMEASFQADESPKSFTACYNIPDDMWHIEVVGTGEIVMKIHPEIVSSTEDAMHFFKRHTE